MRRVPVPAGGPVAAVLVAVLVAVSVTACSSQLVTGHGGLDRAVGARTSPSAAPGSVSSAPPSGTTPSPSASPSVPVDRQLLDRLRDIAVLPWDRVRDARSGTAFQLPERVAATTTVQSGVSRRAYTYQLTKQSGVSVAFVHTGSAAASAAQLAGYPDELERALRVVGVDDAAVSARSSAPLDGHPSIAFRFSFTPLAPPQISPVWLVRVVAAGANVMLLQTIVFPTTTRYDYLPLVQAVQRRLVSSTTL